MDNEFFKYLMNKSRNSINEATPVATNLNNTKLINKNTKTVKGMNIAQIERAIKMASRYLPPDALEAAKNVMINKYNASKAGSLQSAPIYH